MKISKLNNNINIKNQLRELGVEGGGIKILSKKAEHHLIYIEDMHVGAANILKQDALSVGADLAVPKGTIIAQTPSVNALLIATTRELESLAKKELAQPFGLKELAKKLQAIVKIEKPVAAKIMGVINANDDSFYNKSRFFGKEAIAVIEKMIEDGADIIDIGGVSSRPGAKRVSVEEEYARVREILEVIAQEELYKKVRFSIDSYEPEVVKKALDSGFCIVNDITGFSSEELCQLCSEYDATAVVMHMQGIPENMQHNPQYGNILEELTLFFQNRIEKLEAYGVKDIVLDVGIGFGKRLEDNLMLLRNLEHFLCLEKELLVGASRKSMIDMISASFVEERIGGTLALHLEAFRNGASILRVHDVYEHKQALRIEEALINCC
jgi:dihydropteroate synthase